ncbi:ATP-binding protein [Actinoplanes sp. HUAS TT8]|uniref:ATP-binding protein n=1 Tax=Actinoplanes sp. HUAS TT8 TaxID=3447453 RepID=UPI003F524F34
MRHLTREPESVLAVRDLLEDVLRPMGVTDGCRNELAVAVSEACTNAVVHARGSDLYRFSAGFDPQWCHVEVADWGVGVDPRRHRGEAPMPPPGAQGGRGLPLMRAFTDHLTLGPTSPTGLTVSLVKRLRYAGDPRPA